MPRKATRVSPALQRLDDTRPLRAQVVADITQSKLTALDLLAQIDYVNGLSLDGLADQVRYGVQRTLVETIVLGATLREAKKRLGRGFQEWVHHETDILAPSTARYCISVCEDFLLVFNKYKDANLSLLTAKQIRADAKALRLPVTETRRESKLPRTPTKATETETTSSLWDEAQAHEHCSCVPTLQRIITALEDERDQLRWQVNALSKHSFAALVLERTVIDTPVRGQPTPKSYSARKGSK